MQWWGQLLDRTQVQCDRTMRAKVGLLVSGSLLVGAVAVAAQPVPCASVAPEVRDRVREAGACRDGAADDAAAPSATVIIKLSDGTVVRVPREIGSNINEGRKHAPSNDTAPPTGTAGARASMQSEPKAPADPPLASQKRHVPDVIGRSYADAGNAVAVFIVDRIETASAARAGEVLAQEPAPASLALPGSRVSVQVSDGSLAGSAGADKMSARPDAAPSAPAPTSDRAPVVVADLAPAATRTPQPATRGRFSADFSSSTALVLGAGVLLGLMLGALLMRQWLLRRASGAEEDVAAPTFDRNESGGTATGVSAAEAVPEVRFAARRDPAETTIELAPLADDEAVPTGHPSEKHG